MTHPIYSEQHLTTLKRPQLWSICDQLALPKYPASAKCVEEILAKQERQVEKIAEVKEEITTREITFYDHEVLAGEDVIAEITHDADDFVTQRWVVTVSGVEQHRADTWQKCYGYVCLNYKRGTLPKHEVEQQPQSDNAVLTQISTECEKYGLGIGNDILFNSFEYLRCWGDFHVMPCPCGATTQSVLVAQNLYRVLISTYPDKKIWTTL